MRIAYGSVDAVTWDAWRDLKYQGIHEKCIFDDKAVRSLRRGSFSEEWPYQLERFPPYISFTFEKEEFYNKKLCVRFPADSIGLMTFYNFVMRHSPYLALQLGYFVTSRARIAELQIGHRQALEFTPLYDEKRFSRVSFLQFVRRVEYRPK